MATLTEQRLIEQAVLDYYEGWFDGDEARMDRALHPELAKRRLHPDALSTVTKERMLELTRAHEGEEDGVDRRLEIVVEDVHGGIANVTARSAVYYEYLQLLRTREGWKILNVLFELM